MHRVQCIEIEHGIEYEAEYEWYLAGANARVSLIRAVRSAED